MAKIKVIEVPEYPEIEILAKSVDTLTGSIDRKPIGRSLITLEAVDKKYTAVGGDDTLVKTVVEAGETELWVELVGGIKSLASYKFFGGWTAKNLENPEVFELYTTEADKVEKIAATAERMCEAHPECDGQWKIVDKDGNRWFARKVCTSLRENGKID